jgi:hypothetical protein
VLGGGNVPKLKELPPGCREGDQANAFIGGFRLWQEAGNSMPSTLKGMIRRPISPVSIDAMNAAIKRRGASR